MSVQEGLIKPPPIKDSDKVLYLVMTLASLVLIGPLSLFGGAVLCNWLRVPRRGHEYVYFALGVLGGLLLTYAGHEMFFGQYESLYHDLMTLKGGAQFGSIFSSYGTICFLSIPLSPSVAGGLLMFDEIRKALRPYSTSEEWKEEQLKLEAKAQASAELDAQALTSNHPEQVTPNELYLGVHLGGESLPRGKQSNGLRQSGRWITGKVEQNLNIVREHMFIVGATGAGKTQTLLRLCAEVLKNCPDLDLVVVDGKGDEDVAKSLRALIWKYRKYNAPVVRFDPAAPGRRGRTYHGFRGSADSIYNRLAVMVKANAAEGAGQSYYADRNRDILTLICFAPEPYGPPRSFQEVRQRLTIGWLNEAYSEDPEELESIQTIKQEQLDELAVRLRPLMRMLRNVISEDGFTLEETRAAIFSLDTLSNKDSASRFCEFFIEDFKNYVNRRATRPGLLIIDEFGAFGNENIKDLLSMARSRGWGVALLTQDWANLGEDLQARQVVANCTTRYLMRTDFPEEMAMLAGTKLQVEGSIQRGPEGPTGMGSDRLQHTLKIDPNQVRKAPPGKTWLYRYGRTVQVQISPVELTQEEFDAVPPEDAPSEVRSELLLSNADNNLSEEVSDTQEPTIEGAQERVEQNQQSTRRPNRARGSFRLK